ncbi:outer membrane protein [Pseudorhodoplanes sp.]|uniref:outer membrane protein n=1 Tax=Pseudorhodoplanes sp. TaxID=1934341 RepID=UPI002CACF304|nr:outer membrane beta-barrel protein [Pseudorhodoplanes sp.]HWV51978.1 outer membrane beta-barrel protein [Pseudorhodoplanes sp.]
MQRVVPAVLSAMIATTSFVQPASSADFPQTYAMPALHPIFYNWTGFYIGGQGGYGGGTFDISPHVDIGGWFGGGQIGFNWQNGRSPWVFGVEIDSAFSNIERDVRDATNLPFASAFSSVDYFGSARVRVGYAIDRALVYGTGGVAWAHNELSLYANPNYVGTIATSANNHVGFALGVGLEWALSRSWTMKFEYLYNDLGSANYLAGTVPGGVNADLRYSLGRMGLNYIVDWGRPFSSPKF